MNGWLAKKSNNWLIQIQCVASVQSTLNMWSMFYLGGSGGMSPQKNFAHLTYSVLNLVIFLTEK